jgi:hypothetical protein
MFGGDYSSCPRPCAGCSAWVDGWMDTSILLVNLHGVDRENLTCLDLVVPLTSLEMSVPFQGTQKTNHR